MFIRFLSLFVSIQISDAYVKDLSVIVLFNLNFSFIDTFLFLKRFYSVKYVLLAVWIFSCKSIWFLFYSLIVTPRQQYKTFEIRHVANKQTLSVPRNAELYYYEFHS